MAKRNQRPSAELFNFNIFDGKLKSRPGSDRDVNDLKRRLLPFCTVTKHPDLHHKDFISKLKKIANQDHSKSKFIFIFISTHGVDGEVIFTRDGSISIPEIISYFHDVQCPKIFIIQACRGIRYDDGALYRPDSDPLGIEQLQDNVEENCILGIDNLILQTFSVKSRGLNTSVVEMCHSIPSNCIVAYSTPPERFSWRSSMKGGYYIRAFIKQLDMMIESKKTSASASIDIVRLLVKTHSDLAENFTSYTVEEETSGKKQVGHFVSTLTEPLLLEKINHTSTLG